MVAVVWFFPSDGAYICAIVYYFHGTKTGIPEKYFFTILSVIHGNQGIRVVICFADVSLSKKAKIYERFCFPCYRRSKVDHQI